MTKNLVKHHTSYEKNETVEVNKSEHFQLHRETCQLCKGSGPNLFHAKVSIDPVTYLKKGKVCSCGHWVTFCHNCWEVILGIDKLTIEKLHRNTWESATDLVDSYFWEIDIPESTAKNESLEAFTKRVVRENLRCYPMKNFTSPKDWKIIKEKYLVMNPLEE